jgi:hypothetical protein
VIVAYSTVIGPLMTLMRLIIGYTFVAAVTREVLPSADEIAATRTLEESLPQDGSEPGTGASR